MLVLRDSCEGPIRRTPTAVAYGGTERRFNPALTKCAPRLPKLVIEVGRWANTEKVLEIAADPIIILLEAKQSTPKQPGVSLSLVLEQGEEPCPIVSEADQATRLLE